MLESRDINEIFRFYGKNNNDIVATLDFAKYLVPEDRRLVIEMINQRHDDNIKYKTDYQAFIDTFMNENYNSLQKLEYYLDNNVQLTDKFKEELINNSISSGALKDRVLNIINDYDVSFFDGLSSDVSTIFTSIKRGMFDYDNLTYAQKLKLIKAVLFDIKDLEFEKNIKNIMGSLDNIVSDAFKDNNDIDSVIMAINENLSTFDFSKEDNQNYFNDEIEDLSAKLYNLFSVLESYEVQDITDSTNTKEKQLDDLKVSLSKYSSLVELKNEVESYIDVVDDKEVSLVISNIVNQMNVFKINYKDELSENDKTLNKSLDKTPNGFKVSNKNLDNLINSDYGYRYLSADEIDYSVFNFEILCAELNNVLYDNFGDFGVSKILSNGNIKFETKKEAYNYLYDKITDNGFEHDEMNCFRNLDNVLKDVMKVDDVLLFENLVDNVKRELYYNNDLKLVIDIKGSLKDLDKSLGNIQNHEINKGLTL